MQSENKILVVDDRTAPPSDIIAEATSAAQTGKKELSAIERAKIFEYLQFEAAKKHANRHNTPFDAQLRNKKRAKVKRSRRANLDRILRDKR